MDDKSVSFGTAQRVALPVVWGIGLGINGESEWDGGKLELYSKCVDTGGLSTARSFLGKEGEVVQVLEEPPEKTIPKGCKIL